MPRVAPFAHSIAVVIGIDQYRDGVPQLRTAVNDARRLGTMLAEEHGYDVISLLDGEATKLRIASLLTQELPSRVGADDRVLFYFAGHGVARDGDEGPNGFLLPVDAARGDDTTFLHMPLVHDALLALPCRHMLVILDSCFSGAFRWSGTRDFDEDVGVVHQEKFERYVRDPAWQVLTSAAQDQKAIDQLSAGALGTRPGEGGHSPFALALFDALRGAGDVVPAGGDGLLTATELYLYIEDTLQSAAIEAGKQQTPRLWPLRKHDRGEFLFFIPGRELALPPAPPLTFESNPWRGLGSYDVSDAALFFGRDEEIAALRARIESQSFTVVLGASGSGKSSLVKAGVVPTLRAEGWQVAPIIRPGPSPLLAIAAAIAPQGRKATGATADSIAAMIKSRLAATPGARLVLVIDQFEEMITLARRSGERERVMALLARLIAAHPDTLRIVITLRSDFEPNFDRSALGARWQQGRYVVPLMSRSALRDVIEKPATARVMYFDPSSLVESLLDEVMATPGALPLLSFALSEMYIRYVQRQSRDRAITREDFDAVGGVIGALRSRAEAEHDALDETGRGTLRRVMLRLVNTESTAIVRRRAGNTELDFASPAERDRAATIVQRLVDARLLTQGMELDGERFVEPAHDALVRSWGRLAEWVRQENEAIFALPQQQRLQRAAQEWHRAEGAGKRGLLWSDAARSAQLLPLVRREAPWLTVTELAFARRSIRGRRMVLAGIATAIAAVLVAGVLALIGGRLASARAEQVRIASIVRSATAMVGEDPLLAEQFLGSLDSTMVQQADNATQLAMIGAAIELQRVPRVIAAFDTDVDLVDAVVSSDGEKLATAARDNVVRIWSLRQPTRALELPRVDTTVVVIQFTPDGRHVAVGDTAGRVQLFATAGSGAPVTLAGPRAAVLRLVISPTGAKLLVTYDAAPPHVFSLDGRTPPRLIGRPTTVAEDAMWTDGDRQLAVLTTQGDVEWWPVDGARAPLRTVSLPNDPIVGIDVNHSARLLALGTLNGRLQLHDATSGRLLRALDGHAGAINSIALNGSGTQLASVGQDNEVHVNDLQRGTMIARLRGMNDRVVEVKYAPGGRRLLLASDNSFMARVWSGVEGDAPAPLAGHPNILVSSVFVPNTDGVVTASEDGTVRLWKFPAPPLYRAAVRTRDTLGEVTAARFSSDGRQLALGTRGGTLSVMRLGAGRAATPKETNVQAPVCAIAFAVADSLLDALRCDAKAVTWRIGGATPPPQSSTGTLRVVLADFAPRARRGLWSGAKGELHVWDETTSGETRMVRAPGVVDRRCAALSDNGQLLAFCDTANTVVVSSFVPGRAPMRFRTGGAPAALGFNHGGTMLAVGQTTGQTRLIRLAAPDSGLLLDGPREAIRRFDFSSDDATVLAVSRDGTVTAWRVTDGTRLVRLEPRGVEVRTAQFTPDGRRILTLGYDQTEARLWNTDGSGGSVALPGDGAVVSLALTSPDGRSVLTTTKDEAARLYGIDPEGALQPFRQLRVCLSADNRVRYLDEAPKIAATRAAACRDRAAAPR